MQIRVHLETGLTVGGQWEADRGSRKDACCQGSWCSVSFYLVLEQWRTSKISEQRNEIVTCVNRKKAGVREGNMLFYLLFGSCL